MYRMPDCSVLAHDQVIVVCSPSSSTTYGPLCHNTTRRDLLYYELAMRVLIPPTAQAGACVAPQLAFTLHGRSGEAYTEALWHGGHAYQT